MAHFQIAQNANDSTASFGDALARSAQLTTAQLGAFRSNDNAAFMRFDRELEIAMGAKERAIGALRQHERHHNYQRPRLWKENPSKESCPITFRFAFDAAPTRQFTREVVSARAAHGRHDASGTLIPSFAASLREVNRATSSWAKPSYLACEFPSETVGVNN
jgi:hypothetical protein